MMAKIDSFNYQYTLILRDSDERRITGLVSCHDLERSRRLAKSALRLKSDAAYVDIYPYTKRADELEGKEPEAPCEPGRCRRRNGGRIMGNSAIEWTNFTWNPLTGCTRVSRGCDQCYAFDLHDKRHKVYIENDGRWPETGLPMPKQYAKPFTEIQLIPQRLEQPLRTKQPKMIFVNSMSDLVRHVGA